jgi:hypothetical protein
MLIEVTTKEPDLYPVMLLTLVILAVIALYPIVDWIIDKFKHKK